MILRVEPGSAVPPYEQIRAQIAVMAGAGVLAPGCRLPTIRQLASDLRLAGGTVARAYRELELSGIITSRGRHGTFVAERAPASIRDRERSLLEAATIFAAQAAQAGVDPRGMLERVLTEQQAHS